MVSITFYNDGNEISVTPLTGKVTKTDEDKVHAKIIARQKLKKLIEHYEEISPFVLVHTEQNSDDEFYIMLNTRSRRTKCLSYSIKEIP